MIRARLQRLIQHARNAPVWVWVFLGFAIPYVLFWMYPVFLSAPAMRFFTAIRYIDPIGVDLKQVLNSTKSWLHGGTPYFQYNLYPPFTYILIRPLLLLPAEARYKFLTLLNLACYALLSLVVPRALAKQNRASGVLVLIFTTGLVSYGFQFELERGQFNVMAALLLFLAIWIFHRYHRYRLAAYLLFSVSVQLKLYPLAFLVMFIRDWRDWKSNLRRLGLVAGANAALLFVLGPRVLFDFVNAVRTQSQNPFWIFVDNHAIHSFVTLALANAAASSREGLIPYARLAEAALSLLVVLCMFSAVLGAYRRNRIGPDPFLLLACATGSLLLPAISFDYTLSTLAAPVAIFLGGLSDENREEHRGGRTQLLRAAGVLVFSTAYASTLLAPVYKPSDLLIANTGPALLVMLAASVVLSFLDWPPKESAVDGLPGRSAGDAHGMQHGI